MIDNISNNRNETSNSKEAIRISKMINKRIKFMITVTITLAFACFIRKIISDLSYFRNFHLFIIKRENVSYGVVKDTINYRSMLKISMFLLSILTIVLYAFDFKSKRMQLLLTGVFFQTSIVLFVVDILKFIVNEKRPCYDSLITSSIRNRVVGLESFPSGHTAHAFCFAAYFQFIIMKSTIRKNFNFFLFTLGYIIAFLVGISRFVNRKHHPLDIFVGAVLGTSLTGIVTHMINSVFPEK